jgi:uncharacterized protein YkwD
MNIWEANARAREAHNAHRRRFFLPEFGESPLLIAAAQFQASFMAARGELTHAGPRELPWFTDRIRRFGYHDAVSSESVFWSSVAATPEHAVAAWIASEGHRRAVVGPYCHLGVAREMGRGGDYWCACYGWPVL